MADAGLVWHGQLPALPHLPAVPPPLQPMAPPAALRTERAQEACGAGPEPAATAAQPQQGAACPAWRAHPRLLFAGGLPQQREAAWRQSLQSSRCHCAQPAQTAGRGEATGSAAAADAIPVNAPPSRQPQAGKQHQQPRPAQQSRAHATAGQAAPAQRRGPLNPRSFPSAGRRAAHPARFQHCRPLAGSGGNPPGRARPPLGGLCWRLPTEVDAAAAPPS